MRSRRSPLALTVLAGLAACSGGVGNDATGLELSGPPELVACRARVDQPHRFSEIALRSARNNRSSALVNYALARLDLYLELEALRISDDGIGWYLSMGEHRDKAGAYAMQGAGGALVQRIEGSPSNVIGLPLAEAIGVLRACDVPVVGG